MEEGRRQNRRAEEDSGAQPDRAEVRGEGLRHIQGDRQAIQQEGDKICIFPAVRIPEPSGQSCSGTRGYLGTDILGSIRAVTDNHGVQESYYGYDIFGSPVAGDFTTGTDYGYLGKPYDSITGLYNYGYRDYSPQTVGFTTVDPIRDGANWFAYVNNDPVNYVDLWGLLASEPK